jgi:Iron only hydrogenase large subunit, C-terminal domain
LNAPYAVQELPDEPLELARVRGADLQEVAVPVPAGAPPLTGALVYGFRSIQNLVRRIKRGECKYAFVEVMACPGGCLNGGGQVRRLLRREPVRSCDCDRKALLRLDTCAEAATKVRACHQMFQWEIEARCKLQSRRCGPRVQIRAEGGHGAAAARLVAVEAAYHSRADVRLEWPEEDGEAAALARVLAAAGCGKLRAEFHAREKSVQSSLLDW